MIAQIAPTKFRFLGLVLLCFFSFVGVSLKVGVDTVYFLALIALVILLLGCVATREIYVDYFILSPLLLLFLSLLNFSINGYFGSTVYCFRLLMLSVLGVFLFKCLVSSGVTVDTFRKIFIACLVFHAVIVVAQVLFPDFKSFIYEYSSVSRKTLKQFYDSRYAGLMHAGNAVTSTLHSIALGWAFYYSLSRNRSRIVWLVCVLLLLAAVLLMGRTGLLLFVLVAFYCLFFSKEKRFLFLYFLMFFLLVYMLFEYIEPTLSWLASDFSGGRSRTISTISNMELFSEQHTSFSDYMIGAGTDGRDQYLFESDIGYGRLFLMFGFLGGAVFFFPYALCLFEMVWKVCQEADRDLGLLALMILFVVFVGSYKELFVGMKGITTYLVVEFGYFKLSRNPKSSM